MKTMTPEEVRADTRGGTKAAMERLAGDSDRAKGAAGARELARRLEFWVNFAESMEE